MVITLDELPDGDTDFTVILADVVLRRLAPATVEQDVGGLHTGGRRVLWLPHDRGEVTNTLLGICPAQRTQIY